MTFIPSRDQFCGCLVGQCLGDALGFPVEGSPPEICVPYAGALRRFPKKLPPPGRGSMSPGQYTDDSQLAREWMQSYAEMGRFDPQDYAARIRTIFAEDRIVGRGLATESAARRLADGISWQDSGMPAGQAGNGTAMRAAPVGLIFGDDPAEMVRVAREQSWITHQDPRCLAGAVAIAGAVALASRPGEIRAGPWTGQLAEWVRPVAPLFADEILCLTEWVSLPPEEAVQIVARCGSPDFVDGWKWISPYVVASVLWSLYSFLRAPDDYWETICMAIQSGGDVDTTAAMAGAIGGARVGLDRLPFGLARGLHDQGTWGFTELVELAHRCHAVKERASAA
jgi:ADP-ribosylglycohydrolase